MQTDVSQEEQIKHLIDKSIETYGRLDILINNAQATDSSALPQLIEDTSLELVELCWRTGFLGTFFATKYALPHMKANNYGRIINTASGSGVRGLETFAAYGSQKEAIRGLTRINAQEYGRFGISCNVVYPGAMTEAAKTWKESDPVGYEAATASLAIKYLGDPEQDVAPAVLFLASDDARYVIGQTIGLDGGSTRF